MTENLMVPKKFKFSFKEILSLLSQTFDEWVDDKALKMSASLSYYTIFSMTPLLIIIIAVAGLIFGTDAARGEIVNQIEGLIGREGAEVIQKTLQSSMDPAPGIIASILSIIVLVLGSLGVFLELMESLNIIWGVEQRPGRGIKGLLMNRLSSFSMVMAVAFLLLISLVISALIAGLNKYIGATLPVILPAMQVVNAILSFAIITALFAMIYKYLPDVHIKWKYVTIGAVVTSALFTLGKYLIGLYLGTSSYSSTYGAAGSLVILFVWVNYSAQVFFFGAEFTQVFRKRYADTPLKSARNAVIIPKVSDLIKEKIAEEQTEVKRSKKSHDPTKKMKAKEKEKMKEK
jgi:membrane protein